MSKQILFNSLPVLAMFILAISPSQNMSAMNVSNVQLQSIISSGRIAHYSFDNENANDSSGLGNHGTRQGATEFVNGVRGKGIQFGGYFNPGHVIAPNTSSLSVASDFTMSLWFKLLSPVSQDGNENVTEYGNHALVGKSGDRSGISIAVGRSTQDGKWYPSAQNGRCPEYGPCNRDSLAIETLPGNGIKLKEWHMVTVTHGNGVVKLFLDGKLQSEMSVGQFNLNPNTANRPLILGRSLPGGQFSQTFWYPLNGVIDEVNVFNRALSQTEIESLFAEVAPCEVPFFWQRDLNVTNSHPLRGSCGTGYDTLGEGGCTLTSATMLFRHYGAGTTTNGAEMTPANLSDCMNNNACPFSWISGTACSNNKASNPRRYLSFSYEQLDQELNQNHHPVILQMCRKSDCSITHWILVTGGQGTEPANYTIWDPWLKCGQNMRLQSRNDAWNFIGMAIYDGTPTCGFSTEVPFCALSVSLVGISSGDVAITGQAQEKFSDLNTSSAVSGSATLYRATNISMTVELTAQSSISNVTEMLIWSDTLSNTKWQLFASYVWLPQSNFVYGRFRDAAGNVSEVVSDTINPSAPPVAPDPVRIQLPLVRR